VTPIENGLYVGIALATLPINLQRYRACALRIEKGTRCIDVEEVGG